GGQTLLGLNCHRPPRECQILRRLPGRAFAPGETLQLRDLTLTQPRQTHTVLACQPHGTWGCLAGVNACQVGLASANWRSRLAGASGLTGPELVRLVLQRAGSAHQALDVLTDLIARHGQADGDHGFLIADPGEAFVLEAAGRGWAVQEIQQ